MNGNESEFIPRLRPEGNVEAIAIRVDDRMDAFGYARNGRMISNWRYDGPTKDTYESPVSGEPATWMNAGHIEIMIRDGSTVKFPFKEKESEIQKGTDWVAKFCGTDTFTDDPDGLLIAVYQMHHENPNAFPLRTGEIHRDDTGVFERALKLADIPVRIVDSTKDAWGELRYIVESVNRKSGGASVTLALTHSELLDGSWIYGLGGRTSNPVRLVGALLKEFAKQSK